MTKYDRRPRNNAQLVALCHRLVPNDDTLAAEVGLAIEQPAAYRATFRERLEERGIYSSYEPVLDLPWLALLDGLEARQRVAEVDVHAEPDYVMAAIDYVLQDQPPEPGRWAWVNLGDPEVVDMAPHEFLPVVGRQLLWQGRVLACFWELSDGYPLAVFPEGEFPAIQDHVEQTGYGYVTACLPGNVF